MKITEEQKKALEWAIAMIRPRDDKHNNTMMAQMADRLEEILTIANQDS